MYYWRALCIIRDDHSQCHFHQTINLKLAGKPKGMRRVLEECGLWPERGLVLECPTTHNRPGCNPEGGCCARRVLGAEKGRLQEEVEALGHRVYFHPKFHCELNFIERYWLRVGTTLTQLSQRYLKH